MDQEEILRRFSPKMTPENTGEDFLKERPCLNPSYPQKEIDLHGYFPQEVDDMVRRFLLESFRDSLVFVRIITGHGENSEIGFSVLHRSVGQELKRLSEGRIFDISFTPRKGYFDIFLQYESY